MKGLFYILIVFLVLFSCNENKLPSQTEIYEIRDIGELSTSEYTVGKIIKLDNSQYDWKKYGERKILISCRAKIKAGIDLSQIKKEDIIVYGNTIEIKLPPAKITSFSMDPKDVHTEMESVSGLRDDFTQTEKNDFLKQGEKAIKEDMNNTTILNDASNNAEAFIISFYKQMGFEKIVVIKSVKE